MSYEFFLALRYLRSRRRHRLAAATAVIAVAGIACGVASLIVALALADGFRDELRDKILNSTAHITISRADGRPIENEQALVSQLSEVPGVLSAGGSTYDGAIVNGPKGSAYGVLRGVDETSAAAKSHLSETIVRGSSERIFATDTFPNVVVGSELAARLGVDIGDSTEIIPAQSSFSSSIPNRHRVRVAGIARTGLYEYDSTWIYLPLQTAAAFTGGTHDASVISVQVRNVEAVKNTAIEIKQRLGSDYSVVDWQEANRPLFTALTLERRIGILIIGLIVFIAALNITTTLILLVIERRRDIAVLNAMGASRYGITKIFVIEGTLLGIIGAAAGVLLGSLIVITVNRYQLIRLPPDVYSISNVPLHVNIYALIIGALIAVALSVLATIYPARAAARLHPAELLRNS